MDLGAQVNKLLKLIRKVINWFKGLYFEFLLWLDKYKEKPHYYLTPREVKQIIREYSLLSEGVKRIKRKINSLVKSKSAKEYNKILRSISDMVSLAEEEYDSPKAQLVKALESVYVKKSNKDIITSTDKAKMIQNRIEDFNELKKHKEMRSLLKRLREAVKEGNQKLAKELKQELDEKYDKRKK